MLEDHTLGELPIDLEAVVNFSMLLLVLLIPFCFMIMKVTKIPKRSTLIVQTLGLGFLIFVSGCIISFFVYTDALNILIFLILHSIAFILGSVINLGIIFWKKR